MKRLLLVLTARPAIDAPPLARELTAGVQGATVRERPPARILHAALLGNPIITIGRP